MEQLAQILPAIIPTGLVMYLVGRVNAMSQEMETKVDKKYVEDHYTPHKVCEERHKGIETDIKEIKEDLKALAKENREVLNVHRTCKYSK